jgi:hypothetical protein
MLTCPVVNSNEFKSGTQPADEINTINSFQGGTQGFMVCIEKPSLFD